MNINEFLKLQNEERVFEPIFHEELNKRIDKSESDFQNNRFKTSSELLAKFK